MDLSLHCSHVLEDFFFLLGMAHIVYCTCIFTILIIFLEDLVVIGGDLVDGPVRSLEEAVEPLEWISPKYGTYFVTGKSYNPKF